MSVAYGHPSVPPLILGSREHCLGSRQDTRVLGVHAIRGCDNAHFGHGLGREAPVLGPGAMLPTVFRVLGLANAGERELQTARTEELLARRHAADAAIERLGQLATERGLSDDLIQRLRTKYDERLSYFERKREEGGNHRDQTVPHDEIELLLIAAKRERINDLYRQGTLKDEGRRRLERELDLREASLATCPWRIAILS